jgi:hypothetical protein
VIAAGVDGRGKVGDDLGGAEQGADLQPGWQ